jgi:NAD(P)H-flavin reductase
LDTNRLKASFAHVAMYGDDVPLLFCPDLFLRAGSAGLAPLKAIIGQLSRVAAPRRGHLSSGTRTADGLYRGCPASRSTSKIPVGALDDCQLG